MSLLKSGHLFDLYSSEDGSFIQLDNDNTSLYDNTTVIRL